MARVLLYSVLGFVISGFFSIHFALTFVGVNHQ